MPTVVNIHRTPSSPSIALASLRLSGSVHPVPSAMPASPSHLMRALGMAFGEVPPRGLDVPRLESSVKARPLAHWVELRWCPPGPRWVDNTSRGRAGQLGQ